MSNPDEGTERQPYGQFRPEPGPNADEARPWPVYGGDASGDSPQGWDAAPGPFPTSRNGQQLPSRTGAIWTLIGGLVAMFVVAPVLFFAVVLLPIFALGTAPNVQSATQGSSIIVDDTGAIAVLTSEGVDLEQCTLTGDGQEITVPLSSTYGFVLGENIDPGQYEINCQPTTATSFMVMPGTMLQSVFSSVGNALIWSTVVGMVGIGLTIGGIVWLIRRNRARREFLSGGWGYPGR